MVSLETGMIREPEVEEVQTELLATSKMADLDRTEISR
jgi:hypothetical protein